MCFDMCLRGLDDVIQTFGSMRYRRKGEIDASGEAQSEAEEIRERLQELRARLGKLEGAHLDDTVKCNACNVYHHHNHVKTEWRGESSQGGYDEEAVWAVRGDGSRYVMKPSSPYADG
jgi:hypothetical protein